MEYFKKYNNLTGWLVFAVALATYVLTAAPTADWWDCMEFTATSYKLEVGHPPGAPLFMMIMRLFTMLSLGHTEWVGFAANLGSCVASAFCILFMFWTITRLARKMYGRESAEFDSANRTHVWTVLGAGLIGSLAYTFSDTFWFSAVESEVYALSSMFTALVVWLMIRWDEVADEPGSNRWLILIAYIMGLSIGVHILNLLTIPALVFIYYFRKTEKVTRKGIFYALLAAGGILLVIYKMIMPWTVGVGAWFDRVFVNSFGLPVNSGLVFWVVVLFALVGLGVWITHVKGKVLWNTVLLCVGVILIGYSSYTSVVIRSSVNPPMNSNRPDNAYGLLSLLNRSQYGGNAPLLYGPSYASPAVDTKYSDEWFLDEDGKYHSRRVVSGYVFAPDSKMLFPRIWDANAASSYQSWLGTEGRKTPPTMGDNMRFFFGYQFNFMYWRYFMWNFVGRQDDIQGRGDILHGNWLSGIAPIDALYLGPQDNLPEEIARNPGRNKFFFLPFLLGILGLIAQLSRDKRGFTIVMWLFVMMGIALVVYFNIPSAVRERDYIYAGSFYAFSIWIGLGVLWVQEIIESVKLKMENGKSKTESGSGKQESLSTLPPSAFPAPPLCGNLRASVDETFNFQLSTPLAIAVCALVPALMAAQGWDDHNRSGRSIGHDFGYNMLVSTLPNSIIMNFGDNDTFPLWYNQEVENLRPDVRIMNMSYIGANWYIEQMLHAYNASTPVPLKIPVGVYRENDVTYFYEMTDQSLSLKAVLEWLASRDPKTQVALEDGTRLDYLATRKLILPVNKENALATGIVKLEDAHLMVDSIEFELPAGEYITKDKLVLLDLLANFDWSRPLYVTYPQLFREVGLGDWLQADGWAYRFVPIKTPYEVLDPGRVDTELYYDLVMNRYKYGGSGDPRVEIDINSVTNLKFVWHLNGFVRLANQLLGEKDNARAVEVLDRALAEYPFSKFDYDDVGMVPYSMISAYYAAGAVDRGDALLEDYANTLQEYIEYYIRFNGARADMVADVWTEKFRTLNDLCYIAEHYQRTEQYEAIDAYLDLFGSDEQDPQQQSQPQQP